jgi:tetratricopeptide (TPR) repeat protein
VIPGGDTPVLLASKPMMDWIRTVSPKTQITMSVCTGAFALASTGELDGLKATTHWSAVSELRARYPEITVLSDQRIVDNGHLVTTAGISAGIDGALHVLARLQGDDVAWQRARGMEYAWEPPLPEHASADAEGARAALKHYVYREWAQAASAYEHLLASHPDDATLQFRLGTSLVNSGKEDEGIAHLERAIGMGRNDAVSIAALARAQLGAKRYAPAITNYERALAAGLDDHGTSLYNLACAYALSGHGDEAFGALGRAVDSGFRDRRLLEHDEDLASIRADERFKSLLSRI